jgi:hypothetical protein
MARYFRDEDRLELSGLPVVNWKGDTYRAARINVDLKSDRIQLEGAVSGEVSYEEKKQGEGAAPPGAPAPGKPGAPVGAPQDAPAPAAPASGPAPPPAPATPVDPPAPPPEAPR